MLGIKRMDHVCMAVWKLDERLPMLTKLFGMKEAGRFDNPQAGYNGVTLDIPGSDTQWELLEPCDDDSFLARFLNERGPGLHHVQCGEREYGKAHAGYRGHNASPGPAPEP